MNSKILINKYPASYWKDTTPIGNGKIGCSIYGAIYDERLLLNHESLYDGTVIKDIPDMTSSLTKVRKLMDEKKYFEAETVYTKELEKQNYYANKGFFIPAYDLHMLFETDKAFTNYSRELDLEHGVCRVKYIDNNIKFERTTFVSQVDNCVIINIKSEKKAGFEFALEQHLEDDRKDFFGKKLENDDKAEFFAQDEYIYSNVKTFAGTEYSGVVKVLFCDGKVNCLNDKTLLKIDMHGISVLKNSIGVSDAKNTTIAIKLFDKKLLNEELKNSIDEIVNSFDKLLEDHEKKFSEIFNRTRLELSQEENKSTEQLLLDSYDGNVEISLIEKMADYGRYLLISSSYGCDYPANLQGVWNGDYRPVWCSSFFNNENIEMEYWQAFAGNLSECALPLFNLYEKFMDDYRENAKKFYGCRGILLPLFMDNKSGKKDNLQPHVLYWTGSSAWISAIYYDYYLYSNNKDFLINRAYPFMKEAALFYEDFYVIDENGKLKSYPADSPENRPDGNYMGAKEISVSINPTMDFALLKELLTNLVNCVKVLDIQEEKYNKWLDMLSRIPEYEINEDGCIKEWMHSDFKDNYHHRHQSHIYPLFPGFEIQENNNRELFNAIKKAVEKRLCIGLKEQTGWSFAHMANIYARLGDANKTKECLENIVRFCTGSNLYTYHNDYRNMGVTLKYLYGGHAPYQIDANMGFTAAVYEMLMFSDGNNIKLLPALPSDWVKGSIKGICARNGFIVDIEWNKKGCKTKIYSKFNKQICISCGKFSSKQYIIEFKENETKEVKF